MPNDEFRRLADAWNRAEESLKIAEQISSKAVLPGINELRYAGRKIIQAHDAADEASALLRDARFDCYRAQHDAIDASVGIMTQHVDAMVRRLGYSNVTTALPDLSEFLGELSDVREKIASSRAERDARGDVYDAIESVDLPALRRHYDRLKASEEHIAAEVKRERRWTIITALVIPIVAVLVAAAALFV